MNEYIPISLVSCLLVFFGIFYSVFLLPKRKEQRDWLIFENRVLAVIDGLSLSGMRFGCADFEMRSYASYLLDKAHELPGNQTLLSHTPTYQSDVTYHSHTGLHGDHLTFALLCIIEYGKEHDNIELISQCEQMLKESRIMEAHYR